MKAITAIIKPFKLEDVRNALKEVGISGLTVTEVQGVGRQGGPTETYRGAEYPADFAPTRRIDATLGAAVAPSVVDAVVNAAATGKIGDGKVWVSPVEDLVRIRTGERGADAV